MGLPFQPDSPERKPNNLLFKKARTPKHQIPITKFDDPVKSQKGRRSRAGLIYSRDVAGAVYSAIEFPETFVLLGPNHTGLGAPISLMDAGEWEIPTGTLPIDEKLAHRIAVNVSLVKRDAGAHMFEHSLEVQLPFITYFSQHVKIVPVIMLAASVEECRLIGEGIARAIQAADYPVVIVASSDMSHLSLRMLPGRRMPWL